MAYDDLDTGRAASPRSVTAFFDTQEAADQARQDLVRAGVPSGDVRVAGGETAVAEPAHPHGFWESLRDVFMPDEDRHLYAEGLRRGGVAVSVETDSAAYQSVLDILDRDGAVDMEERAAGWRDEGWSNPGAGGSLGEREMAYAPAGSGTGGFAASRADQPLFEGPMDTAAIEPGSVVPQEAAPAPLAPASLAPTSLAPASLAPTSRAAAGAPDTAYAAAAPGLGTTAGESTAVPGGRQPDPALPAPTRDLSHGRTRVRSYLGDDTPR